MAKSKKDFSTGAEGIFSSTSDTPPNYDKRPGGKIEDAFSSSKKGMKPGETRRTYIVNEDLADDFDAIAYWERNPIKEIINHALQKFRDEYIKSNKSKEHVLPNGMIKAKPEKKASM